eukprot:m.47006 g.47006  ORF g.47006 m.47006 type:complete len:64 (+) comp10436_c0_seq1:473-664(+)
MKAVYMVCNCNRVDGSVNLVDNLGIQHPPAHTARAYPPLMYRNIVGGESSDNSHTLQRKLQVG